MPPELLAPVPDPSRRRSRPPASPCGRWSSSRPTTRWRRRPRMAAADQRVDRVIICTPDKDLGQCVGRQRSSSSTGARTVFDVDGVREKFGVAAGVDPRLPGARRRLGRRLPRAAGLGRQVGRRGAGPLRAPRGRSRRRPTTGTSACATPARSPGSSATSFDDGVAVPPHRHLEVDAPVSAGVDELAWSGPRATGCTEQAHRRRRPPQTRHHPRRQAVGPNRPSKTVFSSMGGVTSSWS